ncbi:MAG: hypothetical protein K2Y05_12420 [Hyphomicrobiaceae bacterium]|nr:hypothetical protein [Hyphomicrobiaceae bacterium]
MKRLDAELRSILYRWLWLGGRDRKQKTRTVAMLDLVADRHTAAPVNRANDPERSAEQWVHWIAHSYFDGR